MKKHLTFALALPMLLTLSSCGNRTLNDGVFTIGLEAAYAPFNFTTSNATDTPIANSGFLGIGKTYVAGYDVSVASFIASDNGYELQARKISWDGLIPALQSGHIDAIIAGMTDTEARRQSVSFSTPYYESDLVMLVRSDSPFALATAIDDFSGARIAAQIGTVQNDLIIDYATDDGQDDELFVPGLIAGTPYETYPDALLALLQPNSGLDGVLAERPIAASMLAEYSSQLALVEFWQSETIYDPDFQISVSIAVALGADDLLEKINTSLEKISLQTRLEWMDAAVIRSNQ